MRSILSSLALAAALAVLAAPAVQAAPSKSGELWTELDKRKRKPIRIPSVAPLAEKAEAASLFVLIESMSKGGSALPPGHPRMPPGAPGAPRGPGGPGAPGIPTQGQGSGFLIHPSGLALTNHHVIEGAEKIKVLVGDSRIEVGASVVGTDPKTDVAIIQLEGDRKDWPALPLGDSEKLKVGDFVVAVGNPFGLARSVSMGIVSARGRRDINPNGRMGLYDFLQTDASINFGNSGGPLLNLSGEVVGMNTAINAAAQGIGFAIPVNMIKRMLPSLKDHGRIIRSFIGVGIADVSPALARDIGLDRPRGALIRQVLPEGPAAEAGVEAGDVILDFDGVLIEDANLLPLVAGDAGVGRKVEMKLLRKGKPRTVQVVLAPHPENLSKEEVAAAAKPEEKKDAKRPPLGLSITDLDKDDRERLELDAKAKGARVVKILPGSSAFRAGLRPDDVVQKVNGQDIADAAALQKLVKAGKPGSVLQMFVLREDTTLFVALTLP
jgi:serine protease Do